MYSIYLTLLINEMKCKAKFPLDNLNVQQINNFLCLLIKQRFEQRGRGWAEVRHDFLVEALELLESRRVVVLPIVDSVQVDDEEAGELV